MTIPKKERINIHCRGKKKKDRNKKKTSSMKSVLWKKITAASPRVAVTGMELL